MASCRTGIQPACCLLHVRVGPAHLTGISKQRLAQLSPVSASMQCAVSCWGELRSTCQLNPQTMMYIVDCMDFASEIDRLECNGGTSGCSASARSPDSSICMRPGSVRCWRVSSLFHLSTSACRRLCSQLLDLLVNSIGEQCSSLPTAETPLE